MLLHFRERYNYVRASGPDVQRLVFKQNVKILIICSRTIFHGFSGIRQCEKSHSVPINHRLLRHRHSPTRPDWD